MRARGFFLVLGFIGLMGAGAAGAQDTTIFEKMSPYHDVRESSGSTTRPSRE